MPHKRENKNNKKNKFMSQPEPLPSIPHKKNHPGKLNEKAIKSASSTEMKPDQEARQTSSLH